MKIDTTFALSEDVVAALNRQAPDTNRRSELVEAAVMAYLKRLGRRGAMSDLEVINAHAAELNAEAEDVLSYQVIL